MGERRDGPPARPGSDEGGAERGVQGTRSDTGAQLAPPARPSSRLAATGRPDDRTPVHPPGGREEVVLPGGALVRVPDAVRSSRSHLLHTAAFIYSMEASFIMYFVYTVRFV